MATQVLKDVMNIVEAAKRTNNNEIVEIAELLNENNEIMPDAPVQQGSDTFSHMVTYRTRLPRTAPRRFNQGATRAISSVENAREYCQMIEMFIEMDKALVDSQPNPQKFRSIEVVAAVEAHMQRFTRDLLYGNHGANPEEIDGFMTRFNALGDNVQSAGGTGDDLSSILIVEWGERGVYLFYPRNAETVGLKQKDLGEVRLTDENGNPYLGYSYNLQAVMGLAIEQQRNVQRIANLEHFGLEGPAGTFQHTNTSAHRMLVAARNRLKGFGKNAVMYTNRDVKTQLDVWALEKSNGFYMMNNISGEPISSFQGIPIKLVDQMLDTESQVQ